MKKDKLLSTYLLGYLVLALQEHHKGAGAKSIELFQEIIKIIEDKEDKEKNLGFSYEDMSKRYKVSKTTIHKAFSAFIHKGIIEKNKDNYYVTSSMMKMVQGLKDELL